MKSVFISVVLLIVVIAMASADDTPKKVYYDVNEAPSLFEKFVKEYNREYKDETDRKTHYDAFVKSLHSINEMNANQPHATFGINQFADYTEEERKSMFGFKNQ
ncbi:cysteine proteinase B-like [Galleria mellonella]|uniref:Cysteine proteinase B-like n=1 Tax=Galleria mellonella TaxID=7137 RepID=A0A6J1WCK9_GALME|nr:cysteine proteinase B-like [Galleria mellonella]